MARRIDHVGIAVVDADSAAAWYIERLGLTVISDESVPAAGARLIYLISAAKDDPVDQTMIQLVQPVADGPIDAFIREQGEGLHHVCFAVDAIGKALTVTGEDETGIFLGGRGRRACFLRARPNNALIEFTESEPVTVAVPWSSGTWVQPVDRR